jgi:hypothetical protein
VRHPREVKSIGAEKTRGHLLGQNWHAEEANDDDESSEEEYVPTDEEHDAMDMESEDESEG